MRIGKFVMEVINILKGDGKKVLKWLNSIIEFSIKDIRYWIMKKDYCMIYKFGNFNLWLRHI